MWRGARERGCVWQQFKLNSIALQRKVLPTTYYYLVPCVTPDRDCLRIFWLCALALCDGTATAACLSIVCFASICMNGWDCWTCVYPFLNARCLSVCVCVWVMETVCNTIYFVFLGKPRFWLFVWPSFARGYEEVVSKTEKHRGTFCLIWDFSFVFSWTCALSGVEELWEREQGTRGKRVEHVQNSRKGIKEETENVRAVRRACHGKAWMLRQCLWRGQDFWLGRKGTMVSIVSSVKVRTQLLTIHCALGATQTSSKQNRKSTRQVSPWVAPGSSRKS